MKIIPIKLGNENNKIDPIIFLMTTTNIDTYDLSFNPPPKKRRMKSTKLDENNKKYPMNTTKRPLNISLTETIFNLDTMKTSVTDPLINPTTNTLYYTKLIDGYVKIYLNCLQFT
jgi:hypothetical protein